MIFKPFRGWRPRADLYDKIPSVPYDVVSTKEARARAEGNPYSFLRVLRPEIEMPEGTDPHDDGVYEKGRDNLHRMMDDGWLERDPEPAYYVYRLNWGDHEQTGVVGAAAVDDALEGRIRKHEHTRPDKEQDRTRHMDALSANVGPLFLTHTRVPELSATLRAVADGSDPEADITADDVRHRLWVVRDAATKQRIERLYERISHTYIADGHHRTAAASNVAKLRLARLEQPTGEEPCNYLLAVYFPSHQLKVLDYNRLVRDLNGLEPQDLLDRTRAAGFEVRADYPHRRPRNPETFGLYVAGRWYLLVAGADLVASSDPLKRLDVSILSRHVLEPILGIGDPRTDQRIEAVGGIRGADELERRVDSGEHAAAFTLHPTSMEQVMQVADADGVMPPKSTWFEPKLRSGLVLLSLEGDTL